MNVDCGWVVGSQSVFPWRRAKMPFTPVLAAGRRAEDAEQPSKEALL